MSYNYYPQDFCLNKKKIMVKVAVFLLLWENR